VLGQVRDEISIAPGSFSLARRKGGQPVRLVLSGKKRHEWLESSIAMPVEADWSSDGKALDLYVERSGSGTLRIYAPGVETLRLNGRVIESRREGEFVRVELR
jgi:hypothetical protein